MPQTAIFIDSILQAYIEAHRQNRYETANEILHRILQVDEVPTPILKETGQPPGTPVEAGDRPQAAPRSRQDRRRSPSRRG
jgi:negative regulator of replication initiation